MKRPAVTNVPSRHLPFRWTGPEVASPGTRPVFLYLRLSRAHGDGQDAIERQRIDLTRMLTGEGGWTIMGEYVDRDSASSYATRERRGWRALNAAITSGRVEAVAFWKLDRTSRIAARCLEWVAQCQRRGVTLLSHQDSSEELNSVAAGAKLVTGVKALLAEAETDTMSERQRAAKRHAAPAGFMNGGRPPFGWQPGPRIVDAVGRSGRRLVPDPVEHPALKDAVTLLLGGAGLRQVATHWYSTYGIRGPSGGLVAEEMVRRAVTSPRMLGYRPHLVPEHRAGVKVELLDYIARTPEGEPVISQEPVCDFPTWMRVQEALSSRGTVARNGWGSRAWLLTGLLTCPCGRPLHGVAQSQKPGPDGQRPIRYVYRCKANRIYGAGACPAGASITATAAEQHVTQWFFDYLSGPRIEEDHARMVDELHHAVGRVEAELAVVREEREALLANQGQTQFRGGMVNVLFGMLRDVQERIDRLETELLALGDGVPAILTRDQIAEAWPTLNNESRKMLLRQVIQRVDLRAGRGTAAARITILLRSDLAGSEQLA
ncbi:recombinase family protein [Lacisediminihabitans profunda]|uniref:Recombinase family protein n=1 Tax=Lacisediminihabitans profunda TaxID=2594790 RepID=A0A5C8UN38_9MICO|nr:recombinase family protein [Lacisediminihabitans profunda]